MAICHKCNKEIKELPFKCKYCGLEFCGRHRLPEDHECEGLKMRKAQLKERLAKGEKLSYEPKVKKELKIKYDSDYEQARDITKPLLKSPIAIIGMVVAVIVIIMFLLSALF